MFIDHPNVLKLYHFFDDTNYVYLIMEYMQEGSLFDYMQKKNEKMSEKEAAEIIIEVSNALSYLHDHFILHRDIKP
jgi:serine/threonine protein kinase